jgi:hypothetical protein
VARLLSDRYGLAVRTEDFVVPFFLTALNRPIQTLMTETLKKFSLRSPIAGTVVATPMTPGALVEVGGQEETAR